MVARRRHMEQVHGALPICRGMLFAQIVCTAEYVCPIQGGVNQQSVTQVFFNLAKSETTLRCRQIAAGRGVAESVAGARSIPVLEMLPAVAVHATSV